MDRDIIDNKYGEISTIEKNAESGYYLVKWKSESYNLQSSYKWGRYVIKAGKLVCDEAYLNTLANFKHLYTYYEN